MRVQRARRFAAMSAAGLLLAGGAAIGAAGTASAAPAAQQNVTTNFGCNGFRFNDCRGFDNFRFRNNFGVFPVTPVVVIFPSSSVVVVG